MKKMNDKGFSFVELIIVIAIMAILVVVISPQFLKYAERARNAADITNASEIVTALQIYASDPDAAIAIPASDTMTITVNESGSAVISDSPNNFVAAALKEAGLYDAASGEFSTRCVSRTLWVSYTVNVKAIDGGLTFSYTAKAAAGGSDEDATKAFNNAMSGGMNTTD